MYAYKPCVVCAYEKCDEAEEDADARGGSSLEELRNAKRQQGQQQRFKAKVSATRGAEEMLKGWRGQTVEARKDDVERQAETEIEM